LQIVVSDIDSEIASKLSSLEVGIASLSVNRYYLSLPVDTRLRRFRVFLSQNDNKRINVLDVFNAGNYDLIHKAHQFTLFRFCLVDIWTVRLINALGEINHATAKNQIDKLMGFMQRTRAKVTPLDQPNSADFMGTYVDEVIALRREKRFARKNANQAVYAGDLLAKKDSSA